MPHDKQEKESLTNNEGLYNRNTVPSPLQVPSKPVEHGENVGITAFGVNSEENERQPQDDGSQQCSEILNGNVNELVNKPFDEFRETNSENKAMLLRNPDELQQQPNSDPTGLAPW